MIQVRQRIYLYRIYITTETVKKIETGSSSDYSNNNNCKSAAGMNQCLVDKQVFTFLNHAKWQYS